jgi:hypothetical protein
MKAHCQTENTASAREDLKMRRDRYCGLWGLKFTMSASLRAADATKLLIVIFCFFAAFTIFVASSCE